MARALSNLGAWDSGACVSLDSMGAVDSRVSVEPVGAGDSRVSVGAGVTRRDATVVFVRSDESRGAS